MIYLQISISLPVKQGFTSSTYTLFSQHPTRVKQPKPTERRSQTYCPCFGDSSFYNVGTVIARTQNNAFYLYQLQISQSFSSQTGAYGYSLEIHYFTRVHSIPDISMENIKTAKAKQPSKNDQCESLAIRIFISLEFYKLAKVPYSDTTEIC